MCFNNEVIERIFMEDFMMTTRVDIDEHASLLHRSSYYLSLLDEDRQNNRSIKLTTRREKSLPFSFLQFLLLVLTPYPLCRSVFERNIFKIILVKGTKFVKFINLF